MKNFKVLNEIGKGAFSEVYKVMRISDGLIYAIKKVILLTLRLEWDSSRSKRKKMLLTKSEFLHQ